MKAGTYDNLNLYLHVLFMEHTSPVRCAQQIFAFEAKAKTHSARLPGFLRHQGIKYVTRDLHNNGQDQ
jgi:hypothetical protein